MNMTRVAGRILLGLFGGVALVLALSAATALLLWDRTFDVPEPSLAFPVDAELVERGRYLAFGPADRRGRARALVGGWSLSIPPGTFYTANLTPDPETGIGAASDGRLARMLRHNVRSDGRAALPVMDFQDLSDRDVVALVAFLRSQPPVRSPVPEHRMNFWARRSWPS